MSESGVGLNSERIDKFFELLGKELTPVPTYTGVYCYEGVCFVELHRVEKDVKVWENSSRIMLKMWRLYTIPAYRGNGYASKVVDVVKQAATMSGCVIFLRANGFEFLQQPSVIELLNGWNQTRWPAAIESYTDVVRYWNTQPRLFTDVLYGEYSNDSICDWYVEHGFRRWFVGFSDALNTGPTHAHKTDACLYASPDVVLPEKVRSRLRKRCYGWQPEH